MSMSVLYSSTVNVARVAVSSKDRRNGSLHEMNFLAASSNLLERLDSSAVPLGRLDRRDNESLVPCLKSESDL